MTNGGEPGILTPGYQAEKLQGVEVKVTRIETELRHRATEADLRELKGELKQFATKAELASQGLTSLRWWITTGLAGIAAASAVVIVIMGAASG